MYRLEKRRLSGVLIAALQYLKGSTGKMVRDSIRDCSDRKRSNSFKLKKGRLRLDRRNNFFTVKVVKH